MPPRHVWSFTVTRPGTAAEIAAANNAALGLLEEVGWRFEAPEERDLVVAELEMILFSGGTDAQLADYLRAEERAGATPYQRTAAEYAALAAKLRALLSGRPGEAGAAAG